MLAAATGPPPEPCVPGKPLRVGGRPRLGGMATWTGWSRARCAGLRRSTETVSGLPPKSILKNLGPLSKTWKGPLYGR